MGLQCALTLVAAQAPSIADSQDQELWSASEAAETFETVLWALSWYNEVLCSGPDSVANAMQQLELDEGDLEFASSRLGTVIDGQGLLTTRLLAGSPVLIQENTKLLCCIKCRQQGPFQLLTRLWHAGNSNMQIALGSWDAVLDAATTLVVSNLGYRQQACKDAWVKQGFKHDQRNHSTSFRMFIQTCLG